MAITTLDEIKCRAWYKHYPEEIRLQMDSFSFPELPAYRMLESSAKYYPNATAIVYEPENLVLNYQELLTLSEAVMEAVVKLKETVMVLNYGPSKTMEKANDVEVAERKVDVIYRELEIRLLSSKMDFPPLILLRDVLQLLEDSADKAEDAADAVRILSFMM